MAESWLSYANLSDAYERKARFLPAVLSVLSVAPFGAALGAPVGEWVKLLVGGVGLGAILAVGLSHLASAMGNRFQARMWPDWPHDSPTNRWLRPDEKRTSGQQRRVWYDAVKRHTGIDIAQAVADGDEVEAAINDAVAALRNLFWGRPEAERLRIHNADYGFARNLAGLRPVWIGLLAAGTAGSWLIYVFVDHDALGWAVLSSVVAAVAIPFGLWILPGYVQAKATYYAESFFGTLMSIDRGGIK